MLLVDAGDIDGDRNERDDDNDLSFSDQAILASGQPSEDPWVADGWDGPARPGGWSDWVDRKVDRGDKWYVPNGAKRPH